MPIKIPVRAKYNNSGSPTGLSEYQSDEYVGVLYGGTGQNTYNSGEVLIGNSSGTLTKNTIQGEVGKITVTNGNGTILISLDSNLGLSSATPYTSGTVRVPSPNAVSEFASVITDGGTGYSDTINVATTGGTSGSSGLTVDITTTDNVVTGVTIKNNGAGYEVNDVITITGGNADAQVTVQTVVTGGLSVDGYGNLSHRAVNASVGGTFNTLGNLEVLKELELDSNGHVMTTDREMINMGTGLELIEDEDNNKYLQVDASVGSSDLATAMAIVFGG